MPPGIPGKGYIAHSARLTRHHLCCMAYYAVILICPAQATRNHQAI